MTRPRARAIGLLLSLAAILAAGLVAAPRVWAQGQDPAEEAAPNEQRGQGPDVNWTKGPATCALGPMAEIKLPEAYLFAGPADTRAIMEWFGNPTDGSELGYATPADHAWFVVFEFDPCGYVKDDEGASLDAAAILESMVKGTEAANEVRRQRGWGTLTIAGWRTKPHYNQATHNLEWAADALDERGGRIVNHNVRVLGRGGVMRADLVVSAESLDQALPPFEQLLTGYTFTSGNHYAEFRSGDKLAEYGLAALITGTGIAVAAKTGLLGKLIKPIIIGVVLLLGVIGKFWNRLRGKPTA